MELSAYLERIGCAGPLDPSPATLAALHRAHLRAIPYENLEIHLGRPLTLDLAQIYARLVDRRRGGWCYEMNGLFAWALGELGFPVRLLSSAVNRAAGGDGAEGNHLILLIELDRPYLADVGFGNGFLEPLPLAEGAHDQGPYRFRLERDGERWQFHNHEGRGPGYDFTLAPRALSDFAAQCERQQTSPSSGFVRATVCHRFVPGGVDTLRGAVLSELRPDGRRTTTIAGRDEYGEALAHRFGLRLPADELDRLWPRVWERHQEWLAGEGQGGATA